MPRITFSKASLSDLKSSLSFAINAIDHLFWFETLNKIITEHIEGELSLSDYPEIKPFRPKRMKFYNDIAKVLGYNNWKEIESTVIVGDNYSSNDEQKFAVHFLETDSELKQKFIAILYTAYEDQFKVQNPILKNQLDSCFLTISSIVVGAIVVNARHCGTTTPLVVDGNALEAVLSTGELTLKEGISSDVIDTGFWLLKPSIIPSFGCYSQTVKTSSFKVLSSLENSQMGKCEMIKMLTRHIELCFSDTKILLPNQKGSILLENPNIPQDYNGIIIYSNILLAYWEIIWGAGDFSSMIAKIQNGQTKQDIEKEIEPFI
ncbi:hypothetical protein [Photobacterium kishitanii]|uniref:Uncharacterized protein n=1 Tax=Photobacterium kishitanii TaxID=318456 RepID=A0A2T3KL34_9GAMM|nr:hypothetical protein [Photobacterium kishitanii]PSV00428.1 hypothetical protein C9J27_04670 [Photobacterium kishitanii]